MHVMIHIKRKEQNEPFACCLMINPCSLSLLQEPPHDPRSLHAFITNGRQGVNYARGTWHHALLTLDRVTDFLVIDRDAPQPNCDEVDISHAEVVLEYKSSAAAGEASE